MTSKIEAGKPNSARALCSLGLLANNQPQIFICRDSACRVTDSANVLAAVDRWFNPFPAPRGIPKT